jgi:hypothetical protein
MTSDGIPRNYKAVSHKKRFGKIETSCSVIPTTEQLA